MILKMCQKFLVSGHVSERTEQTKIRLSAFPHVFYTSFECSILRIMAATFSLCPDVLDFWGGHI